MLCNPRYPRLIFIVQYTVTNTSIPMDIFVVDDTVDLPSSSWTMSGCMDLWDTLPSNSKVWSGTLDGAASSEISFQIPGVMPLKVAATFQELHFIRRTAMNVAINVTLADNIPTGAAASNSTST